MDKRFVLGARLGTLRCVFGLYGRVTVTTRGIVPAQSAFHPFTPHPPLFYFLHLWLVSQLPE